MNATTDQLEQDLQRDRQRLGETLSAIEQRMSPGALLDEAMAWFGSGSKDVAANLGAQVRDNPMPVLLTGVGLAWLMMSQNRTPAAASSASRGLSLAEAERLADEDYEAWMAHDRLREAEWSVVRADGETEDAWRRRVDEARAGALRFEAHPDEDHQTFSQRLSAAAETVKQKGAAARDKFRRMAASARDGTGSAVDSVKAAAGDTAGKIRHGAASTVSAMRDLPETNPVATAAIGVALGALLGAFTPLTRKEEEVLGPVADRGLAAGAEGGRRVVDTLTDTLDRTIAPNGTRPDGAGVVGGTH